MNRSDHLSAEMEQCRKRTAAASPAQKETALRGLFARALPAGVPAGLADELFDLYVQGAIGPGADIPEGVRPGEELFARGDKLSALCALVNGEFDEDTDPFSPGEWLAIGEAVDLSADEMDMGILTSIMSVLLAHDALGEGPGDDGDDDDGEQEDEE